MSILTISPKDRYTALGLFSFALLLFMLVAVYRAVPGYMDESYYLIGARSLSDGKGFNEDILWNFLDDPEGLPHPSHLYWMPLLSIISSIGMKLFGATYLSGCLPMALIAALIPPVVYLYMGKLLEERFWAIIGGLLSMFGGYYFVYYSAVDAFGIYMLLGFAYFSIVARLLKVSKHPNRFVILGLCLGLTAGLMHLTRAEGLIWALLIPVWYIGAGFLSEKPRSGKASHFIFGALAGIGTYLVIMSLWYLRNFHLFGSLTPAGSTSNLFLTTYNDLYLFPASVITSQRWLSQGFLPLLQQRFDALGVNLLSLAGVQLLILQIPLFLVGVWQNWKSAWVKVNTIGMLILFTFFTVVFPLAGMRGSYFHAGTVFQIFIWIMSISGLRFLITKLPVNPDLDPKIFSRFIGWGFLVIFAVITGVIFFSKNATWRNGAEEIAEISYELEILSTQKGEVVMINDPATYNWVTGKPAIVIPSGDEETMLAVMERYDVSVAILQINHPPELDGLYLAPTESDEFDVISEGDSWFLLEKGE